MKRALIWEKDFDLGTWHIVKEVKVIEETPRAVKIKKLIGTEWLPKRGIGLRVEMIKEGNNVETT
mgnify:CR=1 FL=1